MQTEQTSPVAIEIPRVSPVIALSMGVAAVSTGAIFARYSEAPPLVTAAWRVSIATAILLPMALWKSRDELWRLTRADILTAGFSGLFLALHFATWISSLKYTSVANSVVLVNTIPVWVAIMTPWLTRDRMTGRAWAGILTCVAGGIVIGLGDSGGGTSPLFGDTLALAGSLTAAVYLLLGRSLRSRLSLLSYVTVCYGSAALFLWMIVFAARLPATGFDGKTWGALIGMALVSQILGHTSYNWALKFFSASTISVSLLGEPVLSALLAWWLFAEELTGLKLFGAALILCGIYVCATGAGNES